MLLPEMWDPMEFSVDETFSFVKQQRNFYSDTQHIDGHRIDFFNYYGSAGEADFNCDIALEMRGLCFVDGRRFLAQRKFFTLNQTAASKLNVIRDKPVVSVTNKLDGSLVRFIRIGERIVAKTKMTISHPVCDASNAMLAADSKLEALVRSSIEQGIALHFEFVGPENRIVLKYEKTQLVLHSARREDTGESLPLSDFAGCGVRLCEQILIDGMTPSVEQVIDRLKVDVDREGYVVQFADGQMVKMKTEWYLKRHFWCTMSFNPGMHQKQNIDILKLLLTETADDALQMIEDEHVRQKLLDLQATLTQYTAAGVEQVRALLGSYVDDKSFHQQFREHDWFSLVRKWSKLAAGKDQTEASLRLFIMEDFRKAAGSKRFLNELLQRMQAFNQNLATASPQ